MSATRQADHLAVDEKRETIRGDHYPGESPCSTSPAPDNEANCLEVPRRGTLSRAAAALVGVAAELLVTLVQCHRRSPACLCISCSQPGIEHRSFRSRSRNGCALLAAGGTADHVHLLVSLSKSISVVELLLPLKRDSSAWMKDAAPEFSWQDGYGAFSVGESQVEALRAYFAKQKEHHRTATFQDEYRTLLRKYGVEFDERYVWG